MSLRVWLPLNRDLRNIGTDTICKWYQSPNASCTYNSNGYYDFSGYTGFGISNSTSLGSVSTEFFSRYLNNHSFSCSIWAKTASGFDLSSSNGGALITIGYGIDFRFGASGVPLIWLTGTDGAGGTVGNGTAATTNCNDQKWHHRAFSYNVDDNAIKIYVDGVCEGTAYYPSGYKFVGNWTNNITIGKDVNGSTANNRYFFQGSLYDFRIYDHALSVKEVKELSRGLILHYPCNDILNESTTNLITSFTAAANGSTTISNGTVTTSGESKDTYFTINLSESITIGTQYTISCEADMPAGTYWDFPIGPQANTDLTWRLEPGYNTYTFIANDITSYGGWGTQQIFIDDTGGTARTSGYQCKFWNFQLEKKDHATSYTPSSRTQALLKDVSGFDNHSLITGSLPLVTSPKTPRYDKCLNIDNSGTNKNYANCTIAAPQVKSASFWVYIGSSVPSGSMIIFQNKPTHLAFGFYQGTGCITYAGTSAKPCRYVLTNIVKYNSWNHFVISQLEDFTTELWLNGIKQLNPTNDYWGENDDGFCFGARNNQSSISGFFTGKISDFRLFSRVLTQADVDDLYKDSLSIDDTQNAYCYELNESDTVSEVQVTESGITKCKSFSETITSVFDDTEYIEPDGTVWIRIFHHNDPSTNGLFASTDDFVNGVYKDANRWFNVGVCNKVSKWELMVKECAQSNSVVHKYRWIQNANPMIATHDQVKTTEISPITTSGYSNITTYGGIELMNTTTCYICQRNDAATSWWGAIGRTALYSGGIEGFVGSGGQYVVTTGYLDLYLRIDNLTEDTDVKISENGSFVSKELIEI